MPEVSIVEIRIMPTAGQQRVMRPFFQDTAVIHDDDPVGVPDGGEAVGDDDGRALAHDRVQPFLDLHFGEGIDAGCRFVEDEDRRIFKHDPRQGHELPLAHGEAGPSFADVGIQAIGERIQPFPLADLHRRLTDFFIAGGWAAVADILAHGAGKEEGILRNEAGLQAVLAQVQGANVALVDQ